MTPVNPNYSIPPHLQREFFFQTAGTHPPNGVLFGFNTVNKVGELAGKLGCKRALLVTDEAIVRMGFADIVKEAMEKEGIKVHVFDKVEPEPHIETANVLYETVRKESSDLVVGLGGGSAMDMAKLVSLAATNKKEPFELMDKKIVTQPPLKKILIPTTAGTGAEVSMFTVVSVGKDKYFMGTPYAYPEVAIIDPGLTISLPPKITASTGIDALSHAIDSLMNKLSNPFYDSLALGGIELIGKYLRKAYSDGQDLEARYHMAMGATISMMAMSGTGGLYSHSITYALAMYRPMAHGIGCGISLAYTMAFNLPVIESRLALISRAMGGCIESLTARESGQNAVDAVFNLAGDVGMPVNLQEIGFEHEEVAKMAEVCITRYPRANNPRPMSKEECLNLFESMWEGKVRYF
jgi:alcohol dehydrogenase class IV